MPGLNLRFGGVEVVVAPGFSVRVDVGRGDEAGDSALELDGPLLLVDDVVVV